MAVPQIRSSRSGASNCSAFSTQTKWPRTRLHGAYINCRINLKFGAGTAMQKHVLSALLSKYATRPKKKTVAFSDEEPKIITEPTATTTARRGRVESPPSTPAPAPPLAALPPLETLETVTNASARTSAGAGKYTNWNREHAAIAAKPWIRIGELMAFCDKYEFRSLSLTDGDAHNRIVDEVHRLLTGPAPFDVAERFPDGIAEPEMLWICVARCPSIEYHLNRILAVFRRPLQKLAADKQRAARQNFHLAVNELRLDISARITEIRLYDRMVFERQFHLHWQDQSVECMHASQS